MQRTHTRLSLTLAAAALLHSPAAGLCGDLAILSEKTWDKFVPKGKEVDAIYGDFVLRNDKIIVVIANPIAGRNANMTVKDVGGAIIDLTVLDRQSDQLSAYYPGARRFPYRLARIAAEGNVGVDVPVSTNKDHVAFDATDGKLGTQAQVLTGKVVRLELLAPAAADRPEVRLTYTLDDASPAVEVRSEFRNTSDKPIKVTRVDDFRADRTFQTLAPGATDLAWFHDKGWGQAYGVTATDVKLRLTGSPLEPRVIEFLTNGQPTIELAAGQTAELVRRVFPGCDLVAVKATAARLIGTTPATLVEHVLVAKDASGQPVPRAEISLTNGDKFYGVALTDDDGRARLDLLPGSYKAKVTALARGSKELTIEAAAAAAGGAAAPRALAVEFPAAPRVVVEISDSADKPVPCKVQFVGVDGTESPHFFDETGEHAVRNLYYSHNGRFTQIIAPGTYDVIVSYGPEYNVERTRIVAKPGEDVPLKATLTRVVQSPGWISTDFHSHSSPSGDNTSSQLGRVLNLLCEHIEFAPCTEHNRFDSYVPHLKALGVEHLLGTCTGIELTNNPGTINHQNAFPFKLVPRSQDNGAPLIDSNPEEQIKRLALWDNNSDKLVQTNHPDMGEMFYDKDGDGKPDGGFAGMFAYQDVIEVHPIHEVLSFSPLRYADQVVNKETKEKKKYQYNSSIFNWVQLINQGRRLPGVVNTDAHYNFHGSGYIRNYVKCQTDDPAKIDPLDIVHAAEKGHVIMSNGPYLEVTLYEAAAADSGQSSTPTRRVSDGDSRTPTRRVSDGRDDEPRNGPDLALVTARKAIPGDDFALPGGFAMLHVRVQCPNWFDIDRVQILFNGRPEKSLNWTRSANPDSFSGGVVKFDRKIPIEFENDTHVIVIAAAENSTLGSVLGPEYGKHKPTAISNPIFVDTDGGGFKANGDTLGHPLPVKQQRPVPVPTADQFE